jgi:hypothetical protein
LGIFILLDNFGISRLFGMIIKVEENLISAQEFWAICKILTLKTFGHFENFVGANIFKDLIKVQKSFHLCPTIWAL